LREYGSELLEASGEYAEVRRRHRDWYAQLALQAKAEWIGPKQAAWINRLDRELPNIRAAFDFSVIESGEANISVRIAEAMHVFWISRGLHTEGRRWLSRALADSDSQPGPERVKALGSAVMLAGMQGDTTSAAALLEDCRAAAARVDDECSAAIAAHAAGAKCLFRGDHHAAAGRDLVASGFPVGSRGRGVA
jgi:hypothetical protein